MVGFSLGFQKNKKKLSKKNPEISSILDEFFCELQKECPKQVSIKMSGVGGRLIYHHRLGINQKGKRGGLRVIYGCKNEKILRLGVFAKAHKEKLSWEDVKI